MIRRSFIYFSALMMLASLAPLSASAQDEDTPVISKKVGKETKKAASPVVTAVKKVKKVKGRVNDKADYFIFLYSASWCGPCCREMPEIVAMYKDIKKSGKVDIILFSQDKTPAAAKAFVKNFNIKFMTVMGNDEKANKVPGSISPGSIPHCVFVDRYGRKITSGHPGNILSNWETYTIDQGEPKPPAEK